MTSLTSQSGALEYAATFPPSPTAVADARQFVRASLGRNGVSSFTTELIVSELVGNVVRHARTHFTVTVRLAEKIRLAVLDDSPLMPVIVDADPDAERGRGLVVVEALSSAWGASRTRTGKSVWAEVDPAVS